MLRLFANTIEGVAQVAIGTVKLAAAPVTNLVDLEQDHFGDAAKTIDQGVKKIGKSK
jgi:hypothetical protein